jgi:hypothetical protein
MNFSWGQSPKCIEYHIFLNAYDALLLLRYSISTSSNHLEKCSIITKTYWLCQGVKLNGLAKSKLNWYSSPIICRCCKWDVGALKGVQTQSHTIHRKKNLLNLQLYPLPPIVGSTIRWPNNLFQKNCKSIKPQNGPTPHEHVGQGRHVALGRVLPIFIHYVHTHST